MGSTLAEQQALYEKAFNEEVGALEEVDENSSLQSNGADPIAAAPPPVEEHGPRLEVPARHISFSGMPNELVSDFLAVGNDGPCVIHYFWENVTHRHPAALNTEPPKRRSRGAIAWKQMSGQISPGQTQKWPLFFLSDQAGYYRERWLLRTKPELKLQAPVLVTIHAVCEVPAAVDEKREALAKSLQRKVAESNARKIITSLLDESLDYATQKFQQPLPFVFIRIQYPLVDYAKLNPVQESALEKVAQPLLVDLLNLDLASDQTWTLDQLQSLAFALPPLKKGDALEAVSQLSDLLDEAVYRKVESRIPVLERHALCADIVRSLATEVHVLGTRLRMANNLPVKRLSQMKWIEVVPETEDAVPQNTSVAAKVGSAGHPKPLTPVSATAPASTSAPPAKGGAKPSPEKPSAGKNVPATATTASAVTAPSLDWNEHDLPHTGLGRAMDEYKTWTASRRQQEVIYRAALKRLARDIVFKHIDMIIETL